MGEPRNYEVDKLRTTVHRHGNFLTDHEARLVAAEAALKVHAEQTQRHEVNLARLESTVSTLDDVSKTVERMHKTVVSLDHSMRVLSGLLRYVAFPLLVGLLIRALYEVGSP